MPETSLTSLLELSVGSPIGQCRAVPITLGPNTPDAILVIYGADFDIDPYHEMFFFPADTLKMILFDTEGNVMWKKDLGKAVVPGLWFCPVFPFDLDGDGTDEIFFVNNTEPAHPLGVSHYVLERLDAATGKTTGQWPWPCKTPGQPLSHFFRNFILGGQVRGEPVLVTVQGTYGNMHLQAWDSGLNLRWEHNITTETPGARGSHMCPVVDLNNNGVDDLLWGERCIELDTGTERFCADRNTYAGHSDIIQPFLDPDTGNWLLYTIRETDPAVSPRVAVFDNTGNRIWGAVEHGHMDMGWIARLEDKPVASAIRIGKKTCGPDGRFHTNMDEFTFDARTGQSLNLGFSTYRSLPVDLNGDGRHELVCGQASGQGEILNGRGHPLGNIGAPVALACKLLNHPGEQLLAYYPEGTLRIWADQKAKDSDIACTRYEHPFYKTNRRLSATGYNLVVLGGV